jgi:ribosomal protein L34
MRNHRKSFIKRARKCGFLNRQNTKKGRKINASKRRAGREVNVRPYC